MTAKREIEISVPKKLSFKSLESDVLQQFHAKISKSLRGKQVTFVANETNWADLMELMCLLVLGEQSIRNGAQQVGFRFASGSRAFRQFIQNWAFPIRAAHLKYAVDLPCETPPATDRCMSITDLGNIEQFPAIKDHLNRILAWRFPDLPREQLLNLTDSRPPDMARLDHDTFSYP